MMNNNILFYNTLLAARYNDIWLSKIYKQYSCSIQSLLEQNMICITISGVTDPSNIDPFTLNVFFSFIIFSFIDFIYF